MRARPKLSFPPISALCRNSPHTSATPGSGKAAVSTNPCFNADLHWKGDRSWLSYCNMPPHIAFGTRANSSDKNDLLSRMRSGLSALGFRSQTVCAYSRRISMHRCRAIVYQSIVSVAQPFFRLLLTIANTDVDREREKYRCQVRPWSERGCAFAFS